MSKEGKSSGIKDSAFKGGTIRRAFAPDVERGVATANDMGKDMGGSTTNLSHSLRGSSAVQK
jgi:hypothetical protein